MKGHQNSNNDISANIVTGMKCRFVQFRLRMNILGIALSTYRNPITAAKALKTLIRKQKVIMGEVVSPKFVKSNGRYFWTISSVGWPSPAFDRYIRNELNKVKPYRSTGHELQMVIFSITSRCPLKCDHCYEWNNLSSEETLSLDNLETIQKKFQNYGICNIQFSGGEPLTRFKDLIHLIKTAKSGTDLWILTSGFGLTLEKAQELKQAGLTGVVISLDNWDEEKHNRFRKSDKSFYWVKEAVRNAQQVDMVVALSLCAGKDFVTRDNLLKYLKLAKEIGAGFVRILEPRDVGHYEGQKIELDEEQIRILSEFYLNVNSDSAYMDLPLIEYPGYHQRIAGCFGGGDRYLYVDSKADIHACPFCQTAVGNAITDSLKEAIPKLREVGCHKFHTIFPETDIV